MDYTKFPQVEEFKKDGVYYIKKYETFSKENDPTYEYEIIALGTGKKSKNHDNHDTVIILDFIVKNEIFHTNKKIGDMYMNDYFSGGYIIRYLGDKKDFPEYFI